MRSGAIRILLGLSILCLSFANLAVCAQNNPARDIPELENQAYKVQIVSGPEGEKSIRVEVKDAGGESAAAGFRMLRPELTIVYSAEDPAYYRGSLEEGNTPVAAWKSTENGSRVSFPDAGERYVVHSGDAFAVSGREINFSFEQPGLFTAELTLSLEEGTAPPKLSWALNPQTAGWFSAGFTGISPQDPERLDFLYQPLVWSWKRFPAEAVLTPEAFSTTAAVFTSSDNLTEGLAADPELIPYRFATFENSLFGLSLRTAASQARPMIFAPVFGGAGSRLEPGERASFSCYYFLTAGDWNQGVRYLYNDILDYRTERQNATVSLNQTLENMIDYAMDDVYSGWVEELKASDYRFDVPGTVKNVSALHPLSIALTTGSTEIYRRRALPMMEYMLSREKYLYAINDKISKQNPSHFLKGPSMEIAEMTSLHQLTGRRNEVFLKEIGRVFGQSRQLNLVTETGGASWQDYLARYRASGNQEDLDEAFSLADEYLETMVYRYPRDFTTSAGLKDRQASFVTDYTPRWYDLLELYEETGETRYLSAAESGARQMLLWMRSNPRAPDTVITVNKGGVVPGVFPGRRFQADSYEFKEYDTSTEIQEQEIAAWRTSLVGLPPEAPSTYRYGPVMLTHHAAWMLRLAEYTGDSLFRDAAYNAVIGRYANFPGYYVTSLHTNVYQRRSYPLHPYLDVKYNAIFYNHIWPHIALLQDFLVSDALLKSGGEVEFPSAYSPAYAFLTSKVYGHRPGTVFGNKDVYLWLPKGALQISDTRLNYLLGRSEGETYLVFMNTARSDVETTVRLNQDIIPWSSEKDYRTTIYRPDGTTAESVFSGGTLTVNVPAGGLTAIKIAGLNCEPDLQLALSGENIRPDESGNEQGSSGNSDPLGEQSGYFRAQVEVGSPVSDTTTVTGMLLSISDELNNFYVYTDATEKQFRKVSLQYQLGDADWETAEDENYPYEFSLPAASAPPRLKLRLIFEDHEGRQLETGEYRLGR